MNHVVIMCCLHAVLTSGFSVLSRVVLAWSPLTRTANSSPTQFHVNTLYSMTVRPEAQRRRTTLITLVNHECIHMRLSVSIFIHF